MTINEYQKEALRTSAMDYDHYGMIINGALGLAGESGEVADIIKKSVFQGHDLNPEHLAEELGDVAWYLAVTAHAIEYDLDTVLPMNIDKLKKRYPDGFDPDKSIHREEYAHAES